MKACKLEKRTDAVIRWLERMKIAYSSGAVESAYMDAECARADLEDLRSDVFAVMKPSGMLSAISMLTPSQILSSAGVQNFQMTNTR